MFYFAILFDVWSLHVTLIHRFSWAALSKLLIISLMHGHLPELDCTTWWMEVHSRHIPLFLQEKKGHYRSFEVAFPKLNSSRCMHVTVLVFGDEAAAVGLWVRTLQVRQQLGCFYLQCIWTLPQDASPKHATELSTPKTSPNYSFPIPSNHFPNWISRGHWLLSC